MLAAHLEEFDYFCQIKVVFIAKMGNNRKKKANKKPAEAAQSGVTAKKPEIQNQDQAAAAKAEQNSEVEVSYSAILGYLAVKSFSFQNKFSETC